MPTMLSLEMRVCDPAKGRAPLRTLIKEIDIDRLEHVSQAELDVVAFGKEANAACLYEVIKKKKMAWWPRLRRKILGWCGTARERSASEGLPISPPTPGSD
jgi:hypothetical protein